MAWPRTIENFNLSCLVLCGRMAASEKRPLTKGQAMFANFNNMNPAAKDDILRSALFTMVHEAIKEDPEAQFLGFDEMWDLAYDIIYKRGPTSYEVEARLFYHYNHGFRVGYNTITQDYDMLPMRGTFGGDYPTIAKAMCDMYGYNRPFSFIN